MPKGPQITIAICTYNRAGYLKNTLDDLVQQDVDPESFEILVVNNKCTDQTEQICKAFAETHTDYLFRHVQERRQGVSFARNRAPKEASTPVVLYIDDDVKLPENYVRTAHEYLEANPNVLCAGGKIHVAFEDPDPRWIPNELMPMFGLHDLGDKDRLYPSYKFPWAGNMMIHKSVFMKHGYFDTSLGRKGGELLGSEEKAFFEKVRKAGVNVYYWADLELTHLIGKDRLNDSYIRDQSVGIGSSERKRIDESPLMFTKKLLSEFLKLSGSLILAVGYLLLGRPKAARFLIQFRYWVLQGFLNFGHWTPESNHTNKP